MGSIPALIATDVLPLAAGAPLGNAVGQPGMDGAASEGTGAVVAGGFGALFAEQVQVIGVSSPVVSGSAVGSAVAEMNNRAVVPDLPVVFDPTAEIASVAVPVTMTPSPAVIPEHDQPSLRVRRDSEPEISLESLSEHLLEVAPPAVDLVTSAPALALLSAVAPSDTAGSLAGNDDPRTTLPSVMIADPTARATPQKTPILPPVSRTSAAVVVGQVEALRAPVVSDGIHVGHEVVATSSVPVPVPVPVPMLVPTPLDTLQQLPRNGRPVEVQPDRMSYFASVPPSPLAESQAQLVQTLSTSSRPPVVDMSPAAVSVSSSPSSETELATPQVPVPLKTTTIDEAASQVQRSEMDPDSLPVRAPFETDPQPDSHAISEDASEPIPGVVASIVAPLGKSSASPRITERHRDRSVAPTTAVPAAPVTTAPGTADIQLAVPGADEGAPTPVIPIPSADQVTSHVRAMAPTPVSEHARMQDPLRLSEPVAVRDQSATTTASPIPFALGTAGGASTATPAVLPNPLERNIARQLTQQLAAPLATVTTPGAPRKGAVDKSLVIRLTPPELGTVRIEISQRDGQLTVRMHAEDPAVRQAIERMLPTLRTDLRQADAPLHQITIESSGDGSRSGDRGSDRGADDRGSWQGQQQQRHEQRYAGGGGDGSRPVFSLNGMPAPEPVAVISRSRSLGGRSSQAGVDALA